MVKWLRQNSLYFLLIGCILAVGFAAWVLGNDAKAPSERETPPAPSVEVAAPPIETETAPVTVVMPPIIEPTPIEEATAITEPEPETIHYLLPVDGAVQREYAVDCLLYSETMGDWRTHDGVDFAAAVGTPVRAAAKGIVCEVVYDRLNGVTVSVQHPDGFTSVYANLAELDAIVQGTEVSQGDVIGTVGETAMLELSDPPHLHFTLLDGDKHTDPFEKLPKGAAQ